MSAEGVVPATGTRTRPAGTAYLRLLVAGFRRQSAYLAAAWGGLVANVTFGFLKAAILVALVRASGGSVAGYDEGRMLAFVWIGQGLLGLVNMYGRDVIGDRIRTGDIVVDFLRPLNLQLAGLATFLGERLFTLIPRGIPTFLVGLLTTGMALSSEPLSYLLGAVAVVLGMSISYLLVYALNISALWLVEVRGLQVLYMGIAGLLSGLYVPIAIFAAWLHAVALATPFPSVLMTPIDVLSGRVVGLDALALVGVQVVWVLVVGAVGALLTHAGRRHLEVQGG